MSILMCSSGFLGMAMCATMLMQSPACWQVLTEELGGVVGALSFTRSMRWNSGTAFSRPVRWLLALHGSTVLPFQYAGLLAGEASLHYKFHLRACRTHVLYRRGRL